MFFTNKSQPTLFAALLWILATVSLHATANDIHVLVWDERQPRQAEAYDNFLGNEIAAYLRKQPGLAVRSMKLSGDSGV